MRRLFLSGLQIVQIAALAAPALAAVLPEGRPGNPMCQQAPQNGWTVCATTVRLPAFGAKPRDPVVFFHPRHVADGDPKTAWAPGQRGLNLGNAIELRFGEVRNFRYLVLWNGDGRSPKAWAASGRLQLVMIQTSDGLVDRAAPAERNGEQMIVLSRPVEAAWIRLTALAVTPGTGQPAFALSELRPSDGVRPLDVPVVVAARIDDWLPEPNDSEDWDDDSASPQGHSSSTGAP